MQVIQDTLFEYEKRLETENKTRLVPIDLMPSEAWAVHDILTDNIKSGNDWITMEEMANRVGVNEREIRDLIPLVIRKTYMKIISSDKGYKIATDEKEFEVYSQRQIKRAISSMVRVLDLDPTMKRLFYFVLNNHRKDVVVQNQTQIKFTGYELDIVRQFAEDYLTKEERESILGNEN